MIVVTDRRPSMALYGDDLPVALQARRGRSPRRTRSSARRSRARAELGHADAAGGRTRVLSPGAVAPRHVLDRVRRATVRRAAGEPRPDARPPPEPAGGAAAGVVRLRALRLPGRGAGGDLVEHCAPRTGTSCRCRPGPGLGAELPAGRRRVDPVRVAGRRGDGARAPVVGATCSACGARTRSGSRGCCDDSAAPASIRSCSARRRRSTSTRPSSAGPSGDGAPAPMKALALAARRRALAEPVALRPARDGEGQRRPAPRASRRSSSAASTARPTSCSASTRRACPARRRDGSGSARRPR